MTGVFSQLELAMIRSRERSGMENAKSKGIKLGRPQVTTNNIPALFYKYYPLYKNNQISISEFAKICGFSRTTIYKYISLLSNK